MAARKLTEVQMHYVRSFKDEKSPEELSKILKVSVVRVKAALETIDEEPKGRPKNHFANDKGVVSMTKEQSQHEDMDRDSQKRKTNREKFLASRLNGCIGEVYPNE